MDPLDGITVQRADPEHADVRPLIAANLAHAQGAAPAESDHTMDAGALKDAGIRFWTLSDDTGVLGCGALKDLADGLVEVKSVYITNHARRRGLARRLMLALIHEARRSGARAMVLETGTMADYASARYLYQALGFRECGPIAGYVADPNSVFMRSALDPDA